MPFNNENLPYHEEDNLTREQEIYLSNKINTYGLRVRAVKKLKSLIKKFNEIDEEEKKAKEPIPQINEEFLRRAKIVNPQLDLNLFLDERGFQKFSHIRIFRGSIERPSKNYAGIHVTDGAQRYLLLADGSVYPFESTDTSKTKDVSLYTLSLPNYKSDQYELFPGLKNRIGLSHLDKTSIYSIAPGKRIYYDDLDLDTSNNAKELNDFELEKTD